MSTIELDSRKLFGFKIVAARPAPDREIPVPLASKVGGKVLQPVRLGAKIGEKVGVKTI